MWYIYAFPTSVTPEEVRKRFSKELEVLRRYALSEVEPESIEYSLLETNQTILVAGLRGADKGHVLKTLEHQKTWTYLTKDPLPGHPTVSYGHLVKNDGSKVKIVEYEEAVDSSLYGGDTVTIYLDLRYMDFADARETQAGRQDQSDGAEPEPDK